MISCSSLASFLFVFGIYTENNFKKPRANRNGLLMNQFLNILIFRDMNSVVLIEALE